MANKDAAFGLRPVRRFDGNTYNGAASMYYLPATLDGVFNVGQPVLHSGTSGAAGVYVNGISVEGMPSLLSASAGAPLMIGVIVGFLPNPSGDLANSQKRAASTAAIALVADDPYLIFEVQEDSVTSTLTAAAVGLNYDLTAESSTSGISNVELDSDTHNTTVLNVQVLRLSPSPDNNIGANAKWEVRILEHMYAGTTGI